MQVISILAFIIFYYKFDFILFNLILCFIPKILLHLKLERDAIRLPLFEPALHLLIDNHPHIMHKITFSDLPGLTCCLSGKHALFGLFSTGTENK